MKKSLRIFAMTAIAAGAVSCAQQTAQTEDNQWVVDRFDDIKVLKYKVPGFEQLTPKQKEMIYYLGEAAKWGRDILWDQNFKYNLSIRFALETIYTNYTGDRKAENFLKFEKYLKKVWFANGIHHHYSNEKFLPEFSEAYFDELVAAIPAEKFNNDSFATVEELMAAIKPAMFDAELYRFKVNQTAGIDLVTGSATNYYSGVTQAEVEKFYASKYNPKDTRPVMHGLNSQVTKDADGKVYERVWKIGGMYSAALEKIVYWLEKAASVAESDKQKETIEMLISYYKSGDLKEFDQFNILWLNWANEQIDFVNGFTEDYGDPLGMKGAWEAVVNFKNIEATKRAETLSAAAQWFEDNSPIAPEFKKPTVKGVSAKVITVAMLAGDAFPSTAIGINLPNSNWIRAEYGSKSVTIENITDAYAESSKGSGFNEEFMLRAEDRERCEKYLSLADNLHTDMHECLGHGSGRLAPGVKGDELKNYGATLEETRADLFALYYMADQKMIDLGLIPSKEVAWAEYSKYIMNGIQTQLTRIQPGKNVEEAHMRNRKLIAEWCFEKGAAEKVIEKVVENGKTYFVVNDFEKLRTLFGELLTEIQRIKSTGDYEAGKNLVETYAVKVDPELHKEVLERYAKLNLEPYSGFVNPVYTPVMEGDKIIDVKVSYVNDFPAQMLEYSNKYGSLPLMN